VASSTDLQRNSFFLRSFVNPLVMTPAQAAWTTLRAAVDPEAGNGSYWGPAGCFEMKGPPAPAYVPKRAQNHATAQKLWQVSEALTQVAFPVQAP
jgi:hypothetical protein